MMTYPELRRFLRAATPETRGAIVARAVMGGNRETISAALCAAWDVPAATAAEAMGSDLPALDRAVRRCCEEL